MKALLHWLNERSGLDAALRECSECTIPARTRWERIWPSTILFALVVEAVTGIVLWMFYSPSTQSAWESVYWVQYEVMGGWLVRGLHYYAGQVLLGLIILYVLHMIVMGTYRAPRELVFWSAVFMGLVTLALLLTGDLMAWSQGGVKSTQVRTSYLLLLPWIGEPIFKLAVGGTAFGHLTLTRFFALHAGVFSVLLGVLWYVHYRLLRRTDRAELSQQARSVRYWPGQAIINGAACVAVLAVMLALVLGHGMELGPPADPAEAYDAARPDWYFVSLYQLATYFPSKCYGPFNLELLPIFVIPGALVVFVLAMPWIGRLRGGYFLNLALVAVLGVAAVRLTMISQQTDRNDPKYRAAVAAAHLEAERIRELVKGPQGIPPAGALSLLRNDPKVQGPKLFAQHCASCHEWTDREGNGIKSDTPSAPNLHHFASREWLTGFFDPQQIDGPRYFGNTTNFNTREKSKMVKFVKGMSRLHEDLGMTKEELKSTVEKMIVILAEESQPKSLPASGQKPDKAAQERGEVLESLTCTECHKFHSLGALGAGPDLTGYGSREWLIGIISDPAQKRFYGSRNDRMPAYAKTPDKPEENILTPRQIEMLSEWLARQWYEPQPDGASVAVGR